MSTMVDLELVQLLAKGFCYIFVLVSVKKEPKIFVKTL